MSVLIKKIFRQPYLSMIAGYLLIGCNAEGNGHRITLESLLNEMISVEEQARYPNPFYTTKQVSSYDRSSVSPDSAHWFANADGFGIERVDTIDGRLEKVLFDEQGPGVITRIWITTIDKRGTWRFYFDGQTDPGWVIPAYDLMKFGIPALGKGLLQAHTSYIPEGKGGNTLFLPIPYAKSCKVTFEEPEGVSPTPKYYQINYRTYVQEAKLETFSKTVAERAAAKIKETDYLLLNPPEVRGKRITGEDLIAAHDSLLLPLPNGQQAIYEITIQTTRADTSRYAQLMRDLILKAIFDGNETVWVPLGDFSGGGMGGPPVKSWYLEADGKGYIKSRWLMPYQNRASLVLLNTSNQAVPVTLSAKVAPLRWDERSLYFHSAWKQERSIPVHDKPEEGQKVREWNFATLEGKGIYKGDVLSLFNHSPAWYGEGDEKIWVDQDTFPSHFGTGTEDYYNSSWAPVIPFQTPFGGAPRADQESSHGYNTFFRTRHLDNIPFRETFRFDIEMLSWIKGTVDYATTVYWYGDLHAKAKGKSGMEEVATRLLPVPDDAGKYHVANSIEFESLVPTAKSASLAIDKQNMYGFPDGKWSGAAQLTAGGGKPGDSLVFNLDNLTAKRYRLILYATQAADYGTITFDVNSKPTGIYFDGYHDGVQRKKLPLGSFSPIEGKVELKIRISGSHPKMTGKRYMLGLDCIQFLKE